MTPTAKANSKLLLTTIGSAVGVLITVIAATAAVTTKINSMCQEQALTQTRLDAEIARSTLIDSARDKDNEKIFDSISGLNKNQVQLMTTQQRILADVQKLSDKLDL